MTELNYLFRHGARVKIPERPPDAEDWKEGSEIRETNENHEPEWAVEMDISPNSPALRTIRVWFNENDAQVRLLTNDWRRRGKHGVEWKVYYPLPDDDTGSVPKDGGAIQEFDSREEAIGFAEQWMNEHPDAKPGRMHYLTE